MLTEKLTQNKTRLLLLILALGVLVRAGAALYLGNQVEPVSGAADQVSYHNLALRVLGGYGFTFGEDWWPATPAGAPTAHWSYLYTLYLVAVYWLFGPNPLVPRLIQAVIVGLLQPYLAFLLGRRIFGEAVGWTAAALTAVYGYFIFYAGTLMTEPFYITAILGSLYLSIRLVDVLTASPQEGKSTRLVFSLGLTLAAAILLRQLFMLLVPFLFAWIWWASRSQANARPLRKLVLAGLVILAAILPITIYNYSRFDRFVLLNTNAGYAFFWGNHPVYGSSFIPILPDYQSLLPRELLHLDEAALDSALLQRGLQFVLDDPVRYARLSLSRIPVYFTFWPTVDSSLISNIARTLSFGVLWPFMLYGLVRTWLQRKPSIPRGLKSPLFLLTAYGVVYTGIHVLTWTLIRYRLPVDAVMLVFAGAGILDIAGRIAPVRSRAHTQGAVESGPGGGQV